MAHPTWDMGRVITINSATLVNKGLELIEAALLYGVGFDDIVVTVHPQSIVHSMVEFHDGSTIAQASPPDMRLPIGIALTWPERLAGRRRPVRLDQRGHLDVRAARRRDLPRRRARPPGRQGRPAPHPPCTTPPTRRASTPSAQGPSVSRTSPGSWPRASRSTCRPDTCGDDALTVAAVLAADPWGRARASELAVAR